MANREQTQIQPQKGRNPTTTSPDDDEAQAIDQTGADGRQARQQAAPRNAGQQPDEIEQVEDDDSLDDESDKDATSQ